MLLFKLANENEIKKWIEKHEKFAYDARKVIANENVLIKIFQVTCIDKHLKKSRGRNS